MNIFYSHPDPRVATYALDDKRLAKMALETSQILQGAIWNARYGDDPTPSTTNKDDPPYSISLSQRHNPCMLWAGASVANYDWLVNHLHYLCFEHMTRYPSNIVLNVYLKTFDYCKKRRDEIRPGKFFEPSPLMDDRFRDLPIPVTGKYKVCLAHKYLYTDKRVTTFGNRVLPSFLSNAKLLRYLRKEFGDPVHPMPLSIHRV